MLTDNEKGLARLMLQAARVKESDIEWMVQSCPSLDLVRRYYGPTKVRR